MVERQLTLATIAILISYAVALAGGQLLFKLAALRFTPAARANWLAIRCI